MPIKNKKRKRFLFQKPKGRRGKGKKQPTRADWRENHEKIFCAYMNIVRANLVFKDARQYKRPTQTEVAKKAGVSRITVEKHFKLIDFKEACDEARIFIPSIMHNLGKRALENRWDAELFMNFVEEWNKAEIHAFKGNLKIESQEDDLSKYTKAELEQLHKIQMAAAKRKKNAA